MAQLPESRCRAGRAAESWLIGLRFSIIDPIFMMIVMNNSKYDVHHVNVNGRCGEF